MLEPNEIQQVEISIKYSGYIDRQEIEVARLKSIENKQIPQWIDYNKVSSLRTEARHKLSSIRPSTLGQALRISGVSPADISLVVVWIKRGFQNNIEKCAVPQTESV